jgi:hypothetical protein
VMRGVTRRMPLLRSQGGERFPMGERTSKAALRRRQ